MAFPQAARVAKGITEFVGTFFVCLTVSMTKASPIAPIAIGCVLMAVVYAGGHVSGAHYNPAVTLAVLVRGGAKISIVDSLVSVVCQFAGGLCGALFSWVFYDPLGVNQEEFRQLTYGYPVPGAGVNEGAAVLCELMVSMAICLVVLFTTTTVAQANNSYYGMAYGFTVLSGAISVGPICGGAFNPAVGLLPVLYGAKAAETCWIYFLGPFAGAIFAGLLFRLCSRDEYAPQEESNKVARMAGACTVEAFGTAMLCFTIGTAHGALSPLALGCMLMAMTFMGGSMSGGHFNPAVTLAVLLRSCFSATFDEFSWKEAVAYVKCQVLGALIGTLAAWGALESSLKVGHPGLRKFEGKAFAAESLGTFLLAYVFLNVATVKQISNNSFFGLAIGMVLTSMTCAFGPISGGAFNPAVGLMGPFAGSGQPFEGLLVYWVACPIGAALAAAVFCLQNFEKFNVTFETHKFMALAPNDQLQSQCFTKHAKLGGSGAAKVEEIVIEQVVAAEPATEEV